LRNDVQCLHRWNKVLKPGLHKGPWTNEEDSIVKYMVMTNGVGNVKWSVIASQLHGRIGKQCRERWFNHLDPGIKKGEWSEEEDHVVFESQLVFGNRWSEIAKLLPGRTENAVKNRFNSSARKKWLNMQTPEKQLMKASGIIKNPDPNEIKRVYALAENLFLEAAKERQRLQAEWESGINRPPMPPMMPLRPSGAAAGAGGAGDDDDDDDDDEDEVGGGSNDFLLSHNYTAGGVPGVGGVNVGGLVGLGGLGLNYNDGDDYEIDDDGDDAEMKLTVAAAKIHMLVNTQKQAELQKLQNPQGQQRLLNQGGSSRGFTKLKLTNDDDDPDIMLAGVGGGGVTGGGISSSSSNTTATTEMKPPQGDGQSPSSMSGLPQHLRPPGLVIKEAPHARDKVPPGVMYSETPVTQAMRLAGVGGGQQRLLSSGSAVSGLSSPQSNKSSQGATPVMKGGGTGTSPGGGGGGAGASAGGVADAMQEVEEGDDSGAGAGAGAGLPLDVGVKIFHHLNPAAQRDIMKQLIEKKLVEQYDSMSINKGKSGEGGGSGGGAKSSSSSSGAGGAAEAAGRSGSGRDSARHMLVRSGSDPLSLNAFDASDIDFDKISEMMEGGSGVGGLGGLGMNGTYLATGMTPTASMSMSTTPAAGGPPNSGQALTDHLMQAAVSAAAATVAQVATPTGGILSGTTPSNVLGGVKQEEYAIDDWTKSLLMGSPSAGV
jgi:hypothetical protein